MLSTMNLGVVCESKAPKLGRKKLFEGGVFSVFLLCLSPFELRRLFPVAGNIGLVVSAMIMIILIFFRGTINRRDYWLGLFYFQGFYFLLLILLGELSNCSEIFRLVANILAYLFCQRILGLKTSLAVVFFLIGVNALGAALGFVGAILGYLPRVEMLPIPDSYSFSHFYLTLTNDFYSLGGGYVIRPSGIFNECGMLGFYLIHAILLNKLSWNNKKLEIFLITCGLFTMSLGFYFSLVVFLFFFGLNRKMIGKFFAMVILGLTAYSIVSPHLPETSSRYLYKLSFGRLEAIIFSAGQSQNRQDYLSEGWRLFKEKPFWGYGLDFVNQNGLSPSIMGPFVAFGLVGGSVFFGQVFFLMISVIICMGLPRQRESGIVGAKAIFILILNYIQRPFISPVYCNIIFALLAASLLRQKIPIVKSDKFLPNLPLRWR